MAKQKVHFAHYLAVVRLSLADTSTKVAFIPKGAQVLHLSIEVEQPSTAGSKLDVGFEGDLGALANDVDISSKGAHIANVSFEAKDTLELIATTQGATDGSAILRLGYFLPSTLDFEV